MSLFISKEARKVRKAALRAEKGASRVPKRKITLQEYQERARIAERRVKELEDKLVDMAKTLTANSFEWKAKLATEIKEREGLYPVIDEMKRVRATFEKDLAQDRRIISDQQAELVRLRGRTDCEARGPGCYASCRNPCMTAPSPPTPAAPIRNKLPAQCFSCSSFTMFIAQEGCGRDKGTACPRGLDIPAKTARKYNEDMLAARYAAVMQAPPAGLPGHSLRGSDMGYEQAMAGITVDSAAANAGDAQHRGCGTCAKVPGKCEGCGKTFEHWTPKGGP